MGDGASAVDTTRCSTWPGSLESQRCSSSVRHQGTATVVTTRRATAVNRDQCKDTEDASALTEMRNENVARIGRCWGWIAVELQILPPYRNM